MLALKKIGCTIYKQKLKLAKFILLISLTCNNISIQFCDGIRPTDRFNYDDVIFKSTNKIINNNNFVFETSRC